jgi:hypothetical protein
MTKTLLNRMSCTRARVLRLALLGASMLLSDVPLTGCAMNQEALVLVSVNGLSPEIRSLRITERLNGADMSFHEIFSNLSQFALRLPASTQGSYGVQVEGLNRADCAVARGYAEIFVGPERRYTLSVTLIPQSLGPGCEAVQVECTEGTVRPCPNQIGSCAGGNQTCTDGKWGPCSKPPRSEDTCDPGNDDTCNGVPNEGCKCINGTHPCPHQKGVCAGSSYVCRDGIPGLCSVTPDNSWHKFPDPATGSYDYNCDGVESRQWVVNGAWPLCRYTDNRRDLNCCFPDGCIPPPGADAVVCGPSTNICGNASECGDLILFRPRFCSSCGAPWPPDSYADLQGCR